MARARAADALIRRLTAIVGADRVWSDGPELARRLEDLTECEPGHAVAAVRPRTADEVREIVLQCAREKVPITPVVNNTNVGGIAIPREGIVLDLAGLDRILEVNPRDMYMVIEPGVSWKAVKAHLAENYPGLRFGYNLGPPESSVMANCLLDGLTTLSLRYGATGRWIAGLEAVLPDGSLVRTGSAALGPSWHGKEPMPDLTGLFVNWQGTTGIVLRAAIMVWPARLHRRRFLVPAATTEAACEFIRRASREEICDDIGGIGWGVVRMALGGAGRYHAVPGEPAMFTVPDMSSNFEDELAARERALRAIARSVDPPILDFIPAEGVAGLMPDLATLLDLPARLTFLLDHAGGGLTWIGTYGPPSKWEEGIARGCAIQERHGFTPAAVLRPMLLGHYGVLRILATFDKKNPDEVARVRAMNTEVADALLELGFVAYKTPAWLVARWRDRIDPGFRKLLSAVRGVIDPDRIMNPGKWDVGE